MQSRGPHPIPEPVKIPDVEMDPTPNIVEIGSSANIVEMEPPPKLPEKHLKEWEIQVINRGMSVIRKHDGDDSIFRKEEKLLIKQGLKILKNNDIDSSSFFQGREKKQKIFENDESHLLHQDKKPKTGERHLMGFPLDFWGLKEETLTGFSKYTQDTPSTASWRPSSGPPGSFYTTSTPNQGGVGRVTVTPTR